MMNLKRLAMGLLMLMALGVGAGCTPHGYWNLKNRYDVSGFSGQGQKAPHIVGKVFVTSDSLDRSTYEFVAQLDVTKVWYGSRNGALDELANMAREVGADAVIEAQSWLKPAGWAWAAPQASGKAVLLKKTSQVDLSKLSGEYR